MKSKFHAKMDQETISLVQRVMQLTNCFHNDELLKFMAAFTLASYIESQSGERNEKEEKATDSVSRPETGGVDSGSGIHTGHAETP